MSHVLNSVAQICASIAAITTTVIGLRAARAQTDGPAPKTLSDPPVQDKTRPE